jgi:ribosomal protein S18 acetylase RimI-like enzyme
MLDKPVEADNDEIARLVERAGVFGARDVACVRELLDSYFHRADRGGYEFVVYRQNGDLAGMACYGATALTEGTFDLFWICVAPEARREGIGHALLAEVEADIRRRGARLLVIETSGTAEYRAAREFYLAHGCRREAIIRDYYAPGDDLVVFTKRYNG